MTRRTSLIKLLLCTIVISLGPSCSDALTQLLSARRVAADLRARFSKATDASNRAVLATTDEASGTYAREAEQAKLSVRKDVEVLMPLLRDLRAEEAIKLLEQFKQRLMTYEELDRTILDLAVQNTNLKAQKLAFGLAREHADSFQRTLDVVARSAPTKSRCQVEMLRARATLAVRAIQVLQMPHIAEAQDAAMTQMEKQMDEQFATARSALEELLPLSDPADRTELSAAGDALTRFKAVHDQIIPLSRTNSNVRSLELVLGKGRAATAACDNSLNALQEAMAREGFPATR